MVSMNDPDPGLNLIDLKDDEPRMTTAEALDGDDAIFDFQLLKLVEKPTSPKNSKTLQQTLKDCIGYLRALPLKQPNADQRNPQTVINMINILSNPEATTEFEKAMDLPQTHDQMLNMDPKEYKQRQLNVYNPSTSEVLQSFLNSSRRKTSHSRAPATLGSIVKPGCMSLYTKHGITYAVGEGRWWFTPFNVLASWNKKDGMNISLDQDLIQPPNTPVLIIRIVEGEVGLVIEQGLYKLLDTGTHVYNSGTVRFMGRLQYAKNQHIQHGPYNYLNVPRGQYAKVWVEVDAEGQKSVVPRLLKEGEHFIDSIRFQYIGMEPVSSSAICHGSVNILNVEKGFIAKVFHDNVPRLLGEGEHIIESTNFSYLESVSVVDNLCVIHGTITIVRVPRGKIAIAWNKNEPFFIDCPGLYEFNSEDFQFVEFKDANDREIELGAKKVLQVYTGEVGITYDAGKLVILNNGRHVINSSTHVFERFLSTKQRSIRLVSLGASEKLARSKNSKKSSKSKNSSDDDFVWSGIEASDLLVCETKDLVKVGVRADVFYSIKDPDKCIRTLDTDELEDLVRETAVATLTNIIRSTALNQIAQSKNVSASSPPPPHLAVHVTDNEMTDEDTVVQPAAVALFFDRAHDEFMSKLHDDFVHRYGVDIANIRMEAFKIMDTELADQISKHVLTTAQVENELANLEGQSLIATQKERTSAEVESINAQAEAKSLKTRTDAENKRRVDAAKAEAESLRIQATAKAEAEAEAILTKARAEAEAIRLTAAAEAERATRLSETALGQQERLLTIYADMVSKSNEGVSKVIYLDPSVNRDSPFSLGSLDGLNRDIHSLSKLGIASEDYAVKGALVKKEPAQEKSSGANNTYVSISMKESKD